MAATTLGTLVFTDDSGTPDTPTGDGDVINNQSIQDLIALINAAFAGSTFTLGGNLRVEGAGPNRFIGSVNGNYDVQVRNVSAGTNRTSTIAIGNDAIERIVEFQTLSSSFTETDTQKPSGAVLRVLGPGGLSISAEDAAGLVRFYGGGTQLGATVDIDGFRFDKAPKAAAVAPATPDISRLYQDNLPKAWGKINVVGGVPSLVAGYNIDSSLVDLGVGHVRVPFQTPLVTAAYAVSATVHALSAVNNHGSARINITTPTHFDVITHLGDVGPDDVSFSVIVFGLSPVI